MQELKLKRWHLILGCLHCSFSFSLFIFLVSGAGGDWTIKPVVRTNVWRNVRESQGFVKYDSGGALCTDTFPYCGSEGIVTLDDSIDCSEGRCSILTKIVTLQARLSLGALATSFSFISGTFHFLAYFKFDWYISTVKQGINYLRTCDYFWSASLMWLTLSVLWISPPTVVNLILNFWIIGLIILCGFAAEALGAAKIRLPALIMYAAGSAAYVCAWATVIVPVGYSLSNRGKFELNALLDYANSILQTVNQPCAVPLDVQQRQGCEGDIYNLDELSSDLPPLIWVLLIALFITFSVFPGIAIFRVVRDFSGKSTPESYVMDEFRYGYASFLSKITLAATIWAGVIRRSGRVSNNVDFSNQQMASDSIVYATIGACVGVSAVLALIMYLDVSDRLQTTWRAIRMGFPQFTATGLTNSHAARGTISTRSTLSARGEQTATAARDSDSGSDDSN